jgi:NADH-quinone oxidoreductase subunit D
VNKKKTYILNWGPHHPSTHGVLRLILELFGEEVLSCTPDIGYLHRGVEKLVENKDFISIIPYIDRLDYLAPAIQEHAYILAIERLLNLHVPRRANVLRCIFDELTRIASHIMAIGSATYDLGCLSLFLYGFEEREKIMAIFEEVTGARMHLTYYIPGGVCNDILAETTCRIMDCINGMGNYLRAVEKLALHNRVFKKRTKNIGKISSDTAIKNGLSGVNLRASGIKYDVRKAISYGIYSNLNFEPIALSDGDCYARTELRYLEIKQSIEIVKQCLQVLKPGSICKFSGEIISHRPNKPLVYNRLKLPVNTTIYSSTETPRGEFGIHMLIGNEPTKPSRVHFKSPSFASIQLLSKILVGSKLSDVTAILGSLDFIMGCCDR